MERVLNFLYSVKSKPVLIIGKKSLERLRFLLLGYTLGVYESEGRLFEEFESKFCEFIYEKYNPEGTAHHWLHFIQEDSKDDAEAFDKFYVLLDEFLKKIGNSKFDENSKDFFSHKMYVDVPEYTGHRLELVWDPDFTIHVSSADGSVTIEANSQGLISLARHMLALVQANVPEHSHFHLDMYNALEEGSSELIVVKKNLNQEAMDSSFTEVILRE